MQAKKLLIVYTSTHQQTLKVVYRIEGIVKQSAQVTIQALGQTNSLDLKDFDMVVVGGHIRFGKFTLPVLDFVANNYQQLNAMPSAFFGLSLVARKANKNQVSTNKFMQKFLANIAWQPNLVEIFAGAVKYTQYNWWEKLAIRFIMTLTGGDTDTSKDIEYTDWQRVDQFAHAIEQKILL